ncbi:MAG: DNA replication and repair protein RecF [Rectinemataceae bacterium]|nr:DNA replication and repair protein RecF [Rectinemataceae bacterium]
MPFRRTRFASFRNLEDGEIDVDAARIFLIGENGQGKTNFLEALYYLCYGSSFRGSVDAQIPASGSSGFGLMGLWSRDGEDEYLDEEISVRMDGQVKEIRLNGRQLKDRKELVFHNPAVVFCHEDFSFAAGDPERRRFFFDQCAGMLSLSYIETLRSFKRVLKQRNAALKESAYDLLDALDPLFASYGLELMTARRALHRRFQKEFPDLYESVAALGRRVDLEYSTSWPAGASVDSILELLAARREGEIMLGTTRSGPHRDRWNFGCEGELFTDKASTGQLRLVSLILRVIEARAYADSAASANSATSVDLTAGGRAASPTWPVLLLDDVLLELDVGRRRRFLDLLPGPGSGAQAFFTFLPEEPWTEYENGDTIVYKVSHGRFQNQERL